MNKSRKGFIVLLLLLIIAVLVVGGGAYVYSLKKQQAQVSVTPTPEDTKVAAGVTATFEEFVAPNQNMRYELIPISNNTLELKVDGFQTMLRLQAHAEGAGQDSSKLIFDSYAEGNVGGSFKKGDTLFTYTIGNSPNTLIILKWGALQSIDPKNKSVPSPVVSVPGMRQYTDVSFGFSFWYPSDWHVDLSAAQDSLLEDGSLSMKIIVSSPKSPNDGIAIEEFVSHRTSIKDNSSCGPSDACASALQYYFDAPTHTWMVTRWGFGPNLPESTAAANVSNNSMGGLHILQGNARFGDDVIVPLSATHFVVVRNVSAGTNQVSYLAKTIVALDPTVATPWNEDLQVQIIKAEATAYAGF
jgi:hypothetical protein